MWQEHTQQWSVQQQISAQKTQLLMHPPTHVCARVHTSFQAFFAFGNKQKKLSSLKHAVQRQITRPKLQKSILGFS